MSAEEDSASKPTDLDVFLEQAASHGIDLRHIGLPQVMEYFTRQEARIAALEARVCTTALDDTLRQHEHAIDLLMQEREALKRQVAAAPPGRSTKRPRRR